MVPLIMSLYKFHRMKSFGAIIELVFTDYLKDNISNHISKNSNKKKMSLQHTMINEHTYLPKNILL